MRDGGSSSQQLSVVRHGAREEHAEGGGVPAGVGGLYGLLGCQACLKNRVDNLDGVYICTYNRKRALLRYTILSKSTVEIRTYLLVEKGMIVF